jgi:adenosine deaminase
MERIQKTDLHIHLGGSWPMRYLQTIGDPDDVQKLKEFLSAMELKTETDYHKCFEAFALASKIVNSNSRVKDGTIELCRELAQNGVVYTEIRTGLKNYDGEGYETYLEAVMEGIREGCLNSSLQAYLILSLKRNSSVELAQETLRLLRKYRGVVVGLDISDDALLGDSSGIRSIIQTIHDLEIPVALHLGECCEETEEQQMNELRLFNPRRIGHGVFLCESAQEWIYSRRLPIEMCLTSAVQAHMITTPSEHPALKLLREGYPIAICTDDPLIFGTDHIKESELVARVSGSDLSVQEIERIHIQSLSYKFSAS